jgi:hypothetical protein
VRSLLAGGALLVWVTGASVIGAAEPPSTAFTLGVLRRDAMVVPFAVYDGRRWENSWPAPSQDVETPINLRSVPRRWWGKSGPLDTWQVWTNLVPPRLVRVRQPDWLQTHCQKQVGLRTDYQPAEWPPGPEAQPYPKDGLAVAPPRPVEPIETVTSDSTERNRLSDILRAAFAAREETALTRAQEDGAPIRASKKELEALPITVEALYAFGTTRRVYWVEAVREYRRDAGCAAVLFGAGWLVFESGRFTRAEFDVSVVPCTREGLHYMLPLGVISLPKGQYWIAQWSGWDSEEYEVVEISTPRQSPKGFAGSPLTSPGSGGRSIVPVLAVWGGGC